eukprot:2755443-Alexandrium_andersonii.AAC.1
MSSSQRLRYATPLQRLPLRDNRSFKRQRSKQCWTTVRLWEEPSCCIVLLLKSSSAKAQANCGVARVLRALRRRWSKA